MSAVSKKFDGRIYHLAVTRVGKATATAEAKNYRKHGCPARIYQEERGKWDVYVAACS